VNRPESALAVVLLLSVVIVAPATAPQAQLVPHPAVSEFCSGCFDYLEFPLLPDDGAPSSLTSAQQDTLSPAAAGQGRRIGTPDPSLAPSARQ
jgi:hypothetical protein